MKRFPSLESLDRLNYRLLMWGFPLMTLGHPHRQSVGGHSLGRLLVVGSAANFFRDLPGFSMARCCTGGSPRA